AFWHGTAPIPRWRMRTRSRLSYRSTLKTAVPVKAGIHPSTTRAPEKWVPAFAGTPESGLRVYHDIVQRFAADEAVEIGGEVAPAPVGGALGKPRAVRRHQHVRQLVEREARRAAVGVLRAPVLPPHIEHGAADPVAAQRIVKRLFVNDRRAANIDQEGGRLHQRQPASIDQPSGFRPEAGGDQQHVALRQHAVELGERINLRRIALILDRAAIGGDDLAAEGDRALRDLAADPAIPDDADCFAKQLAV